MLSDDVWIGCIKVDTVGAAAAAVVFSGEHRLKSCLSVICMGGCMIMYVSGGAVEADKLILGHAVV